jgi:membrane-bound metal-dependent hydrolase YbcI (DUF457 family)
MFAGHYGPAYATGALRKPPSLGAAFVAVQLVDIAWAIFILAGIEHGRITPGFLKMSALDLYDMPYTHSFAAALAWSVAGALLYRLLDRRSGAGAAVAIGACVFSHQILDFLVHAPDLALYPGSNVKLGLAWWDRPVLAVTSEFLVFAVGFFVYMRATRARNRAGAVVPWVTAILMLSILAFDKLGPEPAELRSVAWSALAAYLLFVALGFWLDAVRVRRT